MMRYHRKSHSTTIDDKYESAEKKTQERKLEGYTLPPETLSTHIPTCYLFDTPQEARQSTLWALLKQTTEPTPQEQGVKHPPNEK